MTRVAERYELSPMQAGMLFHALSGESAGVYVEQVVATLHEPLDQDRLVRAWQRLLERHAVLRTRFRWQDLDAPLQEVLERAEIPVERLDWRQVGAGELRERFEALLAQERRRGFDLTQAPLMRLVLVRTAQSEHRMLWTVHHALLDGHSRFLLLRELFVLYENIDAELAPPRPYRDYIAWLRTLDEAAAETHWRAALSGFHARTPLLPERAHEREPAGRGVHEAGRGVHEARLPLAVTDALRLRARQARITLGMLLQAAWALLLHRYTGEPEVVFGVTRAGRPRELAGIGETLGLFINTLPVRIRVDPEAELVPWLAELRAQHAALRDHEHTPLAKVRDWSAVPRGTPLFESILVFDSHSLEARLRSLGGAWRARRFEVHGETNYPLAVAAYGDQELVLQIEYARKRFTDTAAERMLGHLRALLEAMAAPDPPRLKALPLLASAERRQLEAWNETAAAYPAARCAHEMFEEQARLRPDALAAASSDPGGGRELSYRQLDERAERLASRLRRHGVQPDSLVAVYLERSVEMLVGLLAVWKAGAAYVPIDHEYPPERVRFMLRDSGAAVVLTQKSLAAALPASKAAIVDVDVDEPGAGSAAHGAARAAAPPDRLAYVIYTSGSTGVPKGVPITHRSLCNLICWHRQAYEVRPDDRATQIAGPAFDAAVWEIWPYLAAGASVHLPDERTRLDANLLVRWLAERRITLAFLPTPLAEAALRERWPESSALRALLTGGDRLNAIVRELPVRLINHYGPTENTVVSTCAEVRGDGVPPIGRALPNTQAYVVDRHLQPLPVGIPGELLVGGAQLSPGYWKRPDLSAAQFIANPFGAGTLYKTGDRVRRRPDGEIEFLGRIDHQVKIRGFRIELGEIEAVLARHPAVREAVVLAREVGGDKRLVAYVAADEASIGDLQGLLRTTLPPYMVPAHFVRLDALPLTEHGKVDREALPAPELTANAGRGYEAPVGEVEGELARIWAEVLKLERVGRQDHFFELGGHSLLALSVLERMRRAGLHADVRTLFATPTLAALAAAVGGGGGGVEVPPNRIPPACEAITPEMLPLVQLSSQDIERIVATVPGGAANVQDIYPLAPLQEGILFHHLMGSDGDPYVVSARFGFDTRARLDAYLRALQAVIERHDVLRTAVLWEGLPEPVQVVWRRARLAVEEGIPKKEKYRIDVRQAPLLRVCIAHDAPNARWVMLQRFHHLAVDHITLEAMQREIQAHMLGEAARLPAPLPFRNFVAQARLGVSAEEHKAFFRKMLGDVEEPTAPFGLSDVQGDGSDIAEARSSVDAALARRLRSRARALGVSAASVVHLAWAQVLSRVSGRDDVVFGTLLFGRMQGGAGADRSVGLFINTLPIRIRVGEEGVQDSVRHTHQLLAQLLRHEHAPLALAQRCSAIAAPAPLFSALLNYRHSPPAAEALPLDGVSLLDAEERTSYPLTLSVDDLGEGFALMAQAKAPIDPQRICAFMHSALEALVGALESAPATPLCRLDVLPAAERRQLEAWNQTAAAYPAARCVHQMFEEQAARTPQNTALVFEDQEMTYRELNQRANRLAARLIELGIGPDRLVGLHLARSIEMVVATLAVLKAGGAYVPLDPGFPAERIRYMVEDAGLAVVLTQHTLEQYSGDSALPAGNPVTAVTAANLAYVIYTSGSTGRPKGVMVEHRNVANFFAAMDACLEHEAPGTWLAVTSLSFDISVLELFWTLARGFKVVIQGDVENHLAAQIERHRVTHLQCTPSLARMLLGDEATRAALAGIRQMLVGGEALPAALARELKAAIGGELRNMYGPTETTVWSSTHRVASAADGVPIGRPIANTQIHVVDGFGQPLPAGVPGELVIGGAGVARGYLNRPELTAQRFVKGLYRTGDRARFLPQGEIEFLGRIDHQVKIRGFRIELGEIEATIARHAAIREVVVLAREDVPGDKRLVAYVVGENFSEGELRGLLRTNLPETMVPSAFVLLEKLPLTPNGKVDRAALPAPELTANAGRGYEAPVGEVEGELARIWAEVLKLERVGRQDHFFELGGHSLLALSVLERMRRAGLHADVRTLFATPTLAALAAAVGGGGGGVEVPPNRIPPACEAITPEMLPLVQLSSQDIERIVATVPGGAANVQDIYPLAPLQEGILFHHLMGSDGDPYVVSARFGFDTRARLDAYLRALQAVIERHDVLRTAVLWEGLPEPVQVVWRRARLAVEEGIPKKEKYRIDVRQAPLLRVCIAHDAPNARWVMLQRFHHLAVDHVTLEAMQREIQAHMLGEAARLPAPLPFRNFVAQARLGVSAEEHKAFFRKMLGDVEEPTAPFGLSDVQGDGSDIAEARSSVDAALARRLRSRARALGVSAASVVHLAWAQVLSRVSGRDDVVFGTLLFGRMQGGAGADRSVGLFINTLPIRIRVGEEGVQDSVRHTHQLLAQLLRHEHAPLALAQRCSAIAAPAPLFSALLNYRHRPGPAAALGEALPAGDGIVFLGGEERTNYPLALCVDDLGEGFALIAQAKAPIDPQRICAFMHSALEALVGALESAPATPLCRLDVLPAAERRQLEAWNQTAAAYPAARCVHQMFEEQAARTPQNTALVFEDQEMTYRELDQRAEALARVLRGLGVAPDTLAAILMERSIEMLVAILAVWKAGGAYVPIDPQYPADRVRFMLDDSKAVAVLTQEFLAHLEAQSAPARGAGRCAGSAQQLAYVIYTSGSTGQPKGVAVKHESLFNLVCWHQRAYQVTSADRATQIAGPAFDASVWEVWPYLTAGASVHIPDDRTRLDAGRLVRWLADQAITLSFLPTPLAESVLREHWPATSALRALLTGGDRLNAIAREPPVRLVNHYGPTENTVVSTCAEVRAGGAAPIGRPLPNTRAYVVDRRLQLLPVGVPGELVVGGVQLAAGYWNRPQLTAAQFIEDFPGERLYRTGDRVRWLPDGNIEFLGRIDDQVKIRGYRVELGEIESVLAEHPALAQVAVSTHESGLVGYVVPAETQDVDVAQLRAYLRGRLPEYMVPGEFVKLQRLPFTANGKLDRKALPAPQRVAAAAQFVVPATPTEQALAELWQGLLQIECIGANDNFFESGGHSLLAMQLVGGVRERFGIELPLKNLFERPTLGGLAEAIDALSWLERSKAPPARETEREETLL